MKYSRQILVPLLPILCLSLVFVGCIDDEVVGPNPTVDTPQGPPDDPPPDPPPPPQSSTCLTGSSSSLESIAEKVLSGEYGKELRALLATEVATCINEMEEKQLLSVTTNDVLVRIDVTGAAGTGIVYNDSRLADDIIAGDYGTTARANLHAFIRSFEKDSNLK
jgi:hypothetical protein